MVALYRGQKEKQCEYVLTSQMVFFEINFYWSVVDAGGSDGKESAYTEQDLGLIPGSGRSPGEGNAAHSSIFACRILWPEVPEGLQSMGSQSDMTECLTGTHIVHAQRRVSFKYTEK